MGAVQYQDRRFRRQVRDAADGRVGVVGLAQSTTGTAKQAGRQQVTIDHLDLRRYEKYSNLDLYPVALQLIAQTPPQADDLPQPLDAPDLSEGPHFSYAVQWFIFTTIAVVGYPVILFKVARDKAKEAAWAEADAGAAVETEEEAGAEEDSAGVPTP